MSTKIRRAFRVCRLVDQDAHDADRRPCVCWPVADCPLAEWVLGLFVVGTDGSAGSTEVLRLNPRGGGKTTLVLVVGLLGALVASHGLFKGMLVGCGAFLAAGDPHPALAGLVLRCLHSFMRSSHHRAACGDDSLSTACRVTPLVFLLRLQTVLYVAPAAAASSSRW